MLNISTLKNTEIQMPAVCDAIPPKDKRTDDPYFSQRCLASCKFTGNSLLHGTKPDTRINHPPFPHSLFTSNTRRITCSGKLWRPLSVHIARVYEIWKKDNHSREEERGREKKRGREVTIPISTATFLQYYLWKRCWNTSANPKCDATRKKCRFFNKILIEFFLRRITNGNTTNTFVTIICKLRFELCAVMCDYVSLCVTYKKFKWKNNVIYILNCNI